MEFQQTNILSMTGNSDFATIEDLTNYVDLTSVQTISGIKNFTALPTSSVVPTTGTQLVNKTYVDGSFVTLGTTQTIIGAKTINANLRLNNTRLLIFGTTYPTAGGVITYTTPNLYYDVVGGGYHNFFVAGLPSVDIDSSGLIIRTGKKIYFYAGSYIYENSGGNAFDMNIPTGYQYNFKINSIDKFKIHPTFGCYVTDNLNLTTQKYINWTGGSFQQEDSAGLAYVYNVPTTFNHSFKINNTEVVKISSDVNGTLMTFQSGTIMREYTSFNWFLYQLPASYSLIYQVASTNIMEVSTGGVTMYEKVSLRNGKKVIWDEGFVNEAYLRKDTTNSTLDYEVATGYKHKFSVNGTTVLNIGDSAYGLRSENNVFILNNNWLYLDAFNDGIQCNASGNMNYRAKSGVGNHLFFVGANEVCSIDIDGLQMGVSTLPTTYPKIYGDYNKTNWIVGDGTNMVYNCSNNGGNGTHNFKRNSVDIAFLNQFALSMPTNGCAIAMGTTNQFILQHDNGGTAGQYLVPTGWVHNFQVGGVGIAQIRAEGFYSFQNNTALRLGASSQIEIKHDTATSQIQYKSVGAYSHMFYINNTDLFYEMRQDTFRMLRGWQCKLGATGAYINNNLNTSWNNPTVGLSCWIDTTRIGNFTISDYRVKEFIVPARPVLERLCKIEMIEYELKDISIFKKNGRHHGFIAHQVQELFGELNNIVQGEKDAMTDDNLIQPQTIGAEFTNLYLKAIQELNAKIEEQNKRIDDQQKMINDLFLIINELKKTD